MISKAPSTVSQSLEQYNTKPKIPIGGKNLLSELLTWPKRQCLEIHSCRKRLGPRCQRQSECDRSTQLAPVKGPCSGTPSALLDCTRSPGSRRSPGQGSPASRGSFKSIYGPVAGSPLSLPISGQQRFEAKPALRACGGLAVTSIVRLHLTHIHPPRNVSLFPGRTSEMHASETRSGGKGGGGRAAEDLAPSGSESTYGMDRRENTSAGDRDPEILSRCVHTAQAPRGTHGGSSGTTARSRCSHCPALPATPSAEPHRQEHSSPTNTPTGGAFCVALTQWISGSSRRK